MFEKVPVKVPVKRVLPVSWWTNMSDTVTEATLATWAARGLSARLLAAQMAH
jgi:hypothetical protein